MPCACYGVPTRPGDWKLFAALAFIGIVFWAGYYLGFQDGVRAGPSPKVRMVEGTDKW